MSRKQPTPMPKGIKKPPAPPAPPPPRTPEHVIKFAPLGAGVPVWRKNPPTEPGLYWFTLRTTDKPGEGALRFCRVWERDGILLATAGSSSQEPSEFQRWWAGPLLEPIE